jgi:hypothetical protein
MPRPSHLLYFITRIIFGKEHTPIKLLVIQSSAPPFSSTYKYLSFPTLFKVADTYRIRINLLPGAKSMTVLHKLCTVQHE